MKKKLKSFGVGFDNITYSILKREIAQCVASGKRVHIGYMNLHGAFLFAQRARFREFVDTAHIVYADGFPMVLWRRMLWGDVSGGVRFTLTNELPDFLEFCLAQDISVYYIGSEANVVRAGVDCFKERIQGLRLDGRSGYFDLTPGSSGTQSVLREIEAFGPDVLLVGLGMPRQEEWVLSNRKDIRAPVVYTCGAAIEYFSGAVREPPAWLGPYGLTWLFRLSQEPGKLWYRYLVEPLFLIPIALKELWHKIRGNLR